MLEILDLDKSFKKKEVLKNISISLDPGVYGLLGPNGSGKTTLIRCIVNLYNISKGSIKFQGIEIKNNGSFAESIGYLPQKFGLFKELTVYDNLQYFSVLKKIPKDSIDLYIKEILKIVNLDDKVNDRVSTLSGGMIRRLGIAQAMLGEPEIIIFDEPTAGLDPEERLRFKNILSSIKKNKLIIISTHIVEDVEACCNKLIIMNDGRVLKTGSCQEIISMADEKVFEVKEGTNIDPDCYIQKSFLKNEEKFLRVLSNKRLGYESLNPTIEDGYMCIIKGI
ncbi:ATP-binding cassette domain-containing protein [Proteiniborus sp. MB09-C3]|uniref:ATP-binding cassette domain-containing protein n=1 Tax=Proteiniborus sp. MB09-C3 TaxID=3050072 RepID=UPI0025537812|nr:ATP-binding cassette domain-containing protein [Proteiniborus sp. MB09-C3]WIV13500.1 ATP-binding cassette domain-containing protein [Proteiniborus sp. MB09-C3]